MGDRPASHLNEQQKRGKPYDWKAVCQWCDCKYDKDVSDATNPTLYCSQRCEKEYLYIE